MDGGIEEDFHHLLCDPPETYLGSERLLRFSWQENKRFLTGLIGVKGGIKNLRSKREVFSVKGRENKEKRRFLAIWDGHWDDARNVRTFLIE
jgi:hypothetical protein